MKNNTSHLAWILGITIIVSLTLTTILAIVAIKNDTENTNDIFKEYTEHSLEALDFKSKLKSN